MLFIWMFLNLILLGTTYSDSNNDMPSSCKVMPMLRLTENRYISYRKEPWLTAFNCCPERGMLLHTPESSPDSRPGVLARALREATENALGDNEVPFWVGGQYVAGQPGRFEWFYTTPAGKDAEMFNKYMPEKHFWIEDEPSVEQYCMAVQSSVDHSIYDNMFVGISARECTEERYFICQANDLPRWGKDITPTDRHYCEKQTPADYKELLEGLFVHTAKQLPWQAANYCCEQMNMTLAENFFGKEEQDVKAFEALQQLQEETNFHKAFEANSLDKAGFWVGLTAFCDKTWVWPCGQRENTESDPSWVRYKTSTYPRKGIQKDFYEVQTPDNHRGNEYCGEVVYIADSLNSGNVKRLQKNDMDCNKPNYFMCQKKSCPADKQFQCGNAVRIQPESRVPEDLVICSDITFELLGNGSENEFHISKLATKEGLDGSLYTNLLTWGGYMECLSNLQLTPASFESEEEKEFFQSYFDSDKKLQQKQIWMPAVAQETDRKFIWGSGEPVPPEDILFTNPIPFRAPECLTLGYSKGKVGLIAASCLETHYMVFKKLMEITPTENETIPIVGPPVVDIGNNNTIIDPFNNCTRTNNGSSPCINKDLVFLISSVCPNISSTINRPTSSQLEMNVRGTTEEQLHKLRYQNRKLKQTVIDIAMSGTTYYAHNPRNSHRLASLVAGVYVTQCPEVPRSFIEDILHYLHRLHFFTSRGRAEFLDQADFVWTKKLMQKCVNESKLLNFRTDECSELIYAEGTCDNLICPDSYYQFNITRFDPMMEAWWKMYELAHAVCFEFFDESYRMFHLNAQAFMDTWSEALRLRLEHQIQSNKFWERILGPEYELYLLNMDRCNHAVITQSKMPFRQHISTLPNRVRLHGAKPGRTAENPPPDL